MLSRARKFALFGAVVAALPTPDAPAVCCQHLEVSRSPHAPQDQEQFFRGLVLAAIASTRHVVRYDASYVRIPYPGGDVPASTGACTDEVIRAYRAVGVDLQKEVHQDMLARRSAYPQEWVAGSGKSLGTDTSIDHRRVPNLMVFFARMGESLPTSSNAADYRPGDVVAWNLGGAITHIGIVVDRKSEDGKRCLVVHNIGAGPQMEDVLFHWKVIGHYRYCKTARD